MSLLLITALLSAIAQGDPSPAVAPKRATGVVWVAKPSGDDMARAYPREARNRALSGWVIIECRLDERGWAQECTPLAESPVGIGFGQAGVAVGRKFRAKTPGEDGQDLGGSYVNVPLVFTMGNPVPSYDYLAGRPAALVTLSTDRTAGDFPCPSAAAPSRRCKSHPITWSKSPGLEEGASLVRAANAASGLSSLQCRIQADYHLAGCGTAEADPQRKAAMLALSAMLIAPEKANDETPTSGGTVVIDFNWAALRNAVETSVFTKLP